MVQCHYHLVTVATCTEATGCSPWHRVLISAHPALRKWRWMRIQTQHSVDDSSIDNVYPGKEADVKSFQLY